MREILFRGKRIDNGEWVEGWLVRDVIVPCGRTYVLDEGYIDGLKGETVHPITIGQYTGLTDKNGKRIFEGDVVKVEGKVCEVKYMLGQFFIGINMPVAYKRFDCEVIGNIHDNPELLEKRQ